MTQPSADLLFCDRLGLNSTNLPCCYANDTSSPLCRATFNASGFPTFTGGCEGGNCISSCQNTTLLYSSESQDDFLMGNGQAPIRRFLTCANVPTMASYLGRDVQDQNISSVISRYIPKGTTTDDVKGVTMAVTDCLMSTCRNARDESGCMESCSAVNLLVNPTVPNVQGVNQCLNSLCMGGYQSLPWADADVIGIGVFASYIMQCVLVVLLWFGLFIFNAFSRPPTRNRRQRPSEEKPLQTPTEEEGPAESPTQSTRIEKHKKLFEDLLDQFHNAQCYFSGTIQIASLTYGIFDPNMLLVFMLIPLSINGVLPIVFGYVLLFRHNRAGLGATILTIACWALSSLVYWILYMQLIPINSDMLSEKRKYRAYQQFMYKLSALDACGGYSALAACPNNFVLGRREIVDASHKLRVLTPIIWTFSTVVLCAALVAKLIQWRRLRRETSTGVLRQKTLMRKSPTFFGDRRATGAVYALATLCFLVGIGMQLSLLSIGTSLNMMNAREWGFGQIVAVTIWVPPLLQYLYEEGKVFFGDGEKGGSDLTAQGDNEAMRR